ncbi:MAG TPA: alpha-L-arabinofuranosidase C-terminal domain-containing protein [Acidimicrobiales bacterium]|nr:alpha-L-arabinofuranosidase C-terminal domain-containing protein [Acidimicrobiales bacterium]
MSTVVTVDSNRRLGTIDRRIYGGFVEHLGRCIYGGLYEEGSALSDERGFRRDVLELLKALRLSVLRWPGGNFVSNYHWLDGVGPKASRPVRAELAWGGTESNRFGTDEYLEYCAALGAEPYICFNMGSGSLEEALAWVEYCNSARATTWADRRRGNGHAEPYGVAWWGLGNEIYGPWQVGALSAGEYVAEATRWARAIKMIDPDARLVSCGELGWTDWDVKVIDGLASLVDLHSIHLYTGSEDYWTDVLAPHAAERAIATASTLLRRAAYNQRLKRAPRIVYDEWNVWYRQMTGALEERYAFADALAVGTYLNIFVRNCTTVAMANLAQMVNAIAPIVTTPDVAVVQPIYYPFLLHSTGHLDFAVDAFVEGPSVDAPSEHLSRWPHRIDDLGPFQLVDLAASVDGEHRRVALTLVNRSEATEPCRIELRRGVFGGSAKVRTVTASSAPSGVEGVESTSLVEGEEQPKGAELYLDLPASAFVLIEAEISPD